MHNGKIVIEIRKAGFVNKGAELMLVSIIEKLRHRWPESVIAMAPSDSAPYYKRAQLGLYQKAHLWRGGVQFGGVAKIVPRKVRSMTGIVLDSEVDVVLDAAGFSYSDQWGANSCRELADSCNRWSRNGTKIVLLPQAFGPFDSEQNRKDITKVANCADLIFAREAISYNHLIDVTGERSNIKKAIDFTNIMEGIVPTNFTKDKFNFCIIPNYRMIDKVDRKESELYVPLLSKIVKFALKLNQKPFILVHEGPDDLALARRICEKLNANIPILTESDPLKLKGIIGQCTAMAGSRYHGLVSALSQGVPALATSWSHKYQMLFDDYNFREGVLELSISDSELYEKMELITNDVSNRTIKRKLKERSMQLKNETNDMWADIFSKLEL